MVSNVLWKVVVIDENLIFYLEVKYDNKKIYIKINIFILFFNFY